MKITSIIYCTTAILVLAGCKKFVDTGTPYTLTSTQTVFSDAVSATAAQTAVYNNMVTTYSSFYLARRTGAYCDELKNYDQLDLSRQLYTNALSPNTYNGIWTNSYANIYKINAVLEGITNNNALSTALKNQLTGEAKFVRAFIYFYLVNLYGDIPFITSTDYKQQLLISRTPATQVYQQLIADCKQADSLLSSDFITSYTLKSSTDRIRPTKWAAKALLARLYLFTGDYTNAGTIATEVINNSSLFSLNTNLTEVFLKNSTESIWQLEKTGTTSFYADGYNFILGFYLNTYGESNSSAISSQLLNAFETGDARKSSWIGTYIDFNGDTYYYPRKYKEAYTQSPIENITALRLAEQYLIRAEAKAQTNTIAAIDDLNVIRNRAGLGNYAGATDKPSVVKAILHERQVELFTEWGNRWFDLKRSGTADAVMATVAPTKGGAWNADKKLWPIPQSDRDKNKNLSQNTGY